MYSTVLVPIDGSDESLTAAEEAVEITADDGTLHGLFVIEELPMHKRSGKAEKFEPDGEDREAAAEDALEAVASIAADAGVDCVTSIERGVPSREIVEYAESVDTDAIVMGKRGLADAADDMLGSTTERVVRTAATTVVSVSDS